VRVTHWYEAGNDLYHTGTIARDSYPVWAVVLDRWLSRGHPHWSWWNRVWTRLLPYWGDPFCVAYCLVWSPIYDRTAQNELRLEVGFEKLSQKYRDWYAEENAGLEAEADSHSAPAVETTT
jgi:hypothetical protein